MTLISIIEIVVSVLLIVLAFLAINSKTLIKSVMFLSSLSMLAVIGFVLMKSPDVASGLVTSLFIFTLLAVRKAGKKVWKIS